MSPLSLSRYIGVVVILLFSVTFSGCTAGKTTMSSKIDGDTYEHEPVTTTAQAFKLLEEGNLRFTSDQAIQDNISIAKRADLSTNGQKPFATILSCSDSRVPPELIFDQALGDLFVVRDAGNIVDPVIMGSIEYGAEHLGTSVIIVLGHEKCGAVKATVDGGHPEGSIGEIVKRIQPAYELVMTSNKLIKLEKSAYYTQTEDQNIRNAVQEVIKSDIVKKLIEEKKVIVIGAKYDLDTGKVEYIK